MTATDKLSPETQRLVRAVLDARRKKRRNAAGRRISASVLAVVYGLIGGWELMLAVGIAHHEWLPVLPTIGYWWSVLLVALLRTAFIMPQRPVRAA